MGSVCPLHQPRDGLLHFLIQIVRPCPKIDFRRANIHLPISQLSCSTSGALIVSPAPQQLVGSPEEKFFHYRRRPVILYQFIHVRPFGRRFLVQVDLFFVFLPLALTKFIVNGQIRRVSFRLFLRIEKLLFYSITRLGSPPLGGLECTMAWILFPSQ